MSGLFSSALKASIGRNADLNDLRTRNGTLGINEKSLLCFSQAFHNSNFRCGNEKHIFLRQNLLSRCDKLYLIVAALNNEFTLFSMKLKSQ